MLFLRPIFSLLSQSRAYVHVIYEKKNNKFILDIT